MYAVLWYDIDRMTLEGVDMLEGLATKKWDASRRDASRRGCFVPASYCFDVTVHC